ncbi:MAG: outer membrane lipoprotein carrier protein LolA [Desulfobacteraceae bacterium]|nr:outer membrane lipoprotein carrier protein LolA [Desulfobacteraceae bacterium]MCF8095821.1 outer membrane lipoprotein carrier protein LolA [Desulfobacteraceae bacterium]
MNKIGGNITGTAFFALLLGFSVFLTGWADDLESLKQEVEFVNSIQADFTQEKHLEMMDQPLMSKGRLYFQTPRSLRWEYREPVRSVLLMNKGEIQRYVQTDTGMKPQTGRNLEAMRVFLEEICMWMQGEFEANPDLEAKMKSDKRVVLTPKAQSMAEVIERIELRLTDRPGVIDSVAIYESSSSYTIIRFHDTKINRSIEDAVFEGLNPNKANN